MHCTVTLGLVLQQCYVNSMTEWRIDTGLSDYPDTLAIMKQRVERIASGQAEECCWLVEHPPLYTAGTSAKSHDLLHTHFPVFDAGRGGQYTYHGPGQRVVYIMLNLKQRYSPNPPDIRHFVYQLEEWIISALTTFNIDVQRREGRIGIWTESPRGEAKIAALGIRISKGISFHGIAINVDPDLSHYSGIVPCGISQYGVTSMHDIGKHVTMQQLDAALKHHCPFL